MAPIDPDQREKEARAAAEAAGQGHVFEHWESLTDAEKDKLLSDVENLDYGYLARVFISSMAASSAPAFEGVEPPSDVVQRKDVTPEQVERWTQHGYRLIAEGRVAVLLLAGGQGTRLGSSAPKGCYDIGLPSRKSLFRIQAERLLRLQQLAAEATGTPAADAKPLQWYIMTSAFTHAETVAHFEAGAYFGLQPGQVHFFQQGFLPCLTEEGKLILETRGSLAKAPDGNGGVYLSLARSGALEAMAAAGVECVDCYCVDNALARPGDPWFVGYCHGAAAADVGARVVAKAYPEEKVGVFARRRAATTTVAANTAEPSTSPEPAAVAGGPAPASDPAAADGQASTARTGASAANPTSASSSAAPSSSASPSPSRGALAVLEYSELDPALASAANPATGQLFFNWSNICMHYFSLPWLRRVADSLLSGAGTPYHVARKRIPSAAGPVPGIKLELFIFDTFPLAEGERTVLLEVERREEFAPVKNAPGSATDSPNTARAALLSLHAGWVRAAGGAVSAAEGLEVSPLLSYGGEGLAALVAGKTYDSALAAELQQPAAATAEVATAATPADEEPPAKKAKQ